MITSAGGGWTHYNKYNLVICTCTWLAHTFITHLSVSRTRLIQMQQKKRVSTVCKTQFEHTFIFVCTKHDAGISGMHNADENENCKIFIRADIYLCALTHHKI